MWWCYKFRWIRGYLIFSLVSFPSVSLFYRIIYGCAQCSFHLRKPSSKGRRLPVFVLNGICFHWKSLFPNGFVANAALLRTSVQVDIFGPKLWHRIGTAATAAAGAVRLGARRGSTYFKSVRPVGHCPLPRCWYLMLQLSVASVRGLHTGGSRVFSRS